VSELRTHVVARVQHRQECAALELWFADGTAVWVSYVQMARAQDASGIADGAVCITGATATLENVEGRWVLARLELPK
jgi:hypothetical protein